MPGNKVGGEENYEEFEGEVGDALNYEEFEDNLKLFDTAGLDSIREDSEKSETGVEENYEESELPNNGTVDATWLNCQVRVVAWLYCQANNKEETKLLNIGEKLDNRESKDVGVGCEELEKEVGKDYEGPGEKDSNKQFERVLNRKFDTEELNSESQRPTCSMKRQSRFRDEEFETQLRPEESRQRLYHILVGETKQEVVLINFTTSTGIERSWNEGSATILETVGKNLCRIQNLMVTTCHVCIRKIVC